MRGRAGCRVGRDWRKRGGRRTILGERLVGLSGWKRGVVMPTCDEIHVGLFLCGFLMVGLMRTFLS
jgi:hypothetical protein